MHVCYLGIDSHTSEGGGGIASYLETMSEAMVGAGHHVTMISLSRRNSVTNTDGKRAFEIPTSNIHWYVGRAVPMAQSLATLLREVEWSHCLWSFLSRVLREGSIDIIETGESGIARCAFPGQFPPIVVRAHGSSHAIRRFNGQPLRLGDWLARQVQLAAMRRASAITAVSHFQSGEVARELGWPPEDIQVIPNPVSPGLVAKAVRHPPGLATHSRDIILYTGRVERRKGTLSLIESVPRVRERFPRIQYVIAGARHSSIDVSALQRALDETDCRENVRLLGHIPWNGLAHWYGKAAVFVMPSFYETFGISVVEAMAFGLPVVASNTGGLPEVVEDGVTGLLVPPGDSAAIAEAILQLLRDPQLRARLGQAGRERVMTHFTVDEVLSQTLSFYHRVLRA